MTLALLLLALRMKAILPPAPLQIPRREINWTESHAYRRQRRAYLSTTVRFRS